MKTVFFILGMHRSGTSAITGTINRIGLDIGSDIMPITEDNPKGYYENNRILRLNEKILTENNSSWDDCHFKTSNISNENISLYVAEAINIIKQEFRYVEQFCIKDPRNCLTFPIWEKAFLELKMSIKIIIPYRNPIEVANSLKKRDSFSFEKSLILWSHHFLSAELFSRPYDRVFFSFNQLLNDTENTVIKLNDFIGVKTNNEVLKKIEKFLDVNIKHNNIFIENITADIPGFLQNLFKILKDTDFSNTESIDLIRKDFYYSLEMFHFSEVLISIQNEKNHALEIEKLQNKITMLEKISDFTLLDNNYYLEKYPDLSGYDEYELEQHYYDHGKKEGRVPNQYCEFNSIDTQNIASNKEIIFQQNIKIEQNNQEIISFKNNIAQLSEEIETLKKQKNENEKSLIEYKKDSEKQLKKEHLNAVSLGDKLNQSLVEAKKLKQQLIRVEKLSEKHKGEYEKSISLSNKLNQSMKEVKVLKQVQAANKKTFLNNKKEYEKRLKIDHDKKTSLNNKLNQYLAKVKALKQTQIEIEEYSIKNKKDYERQLENNSNEITSLHEKLNLSNDNFAQLEEQKVEVDEILENALQNIKNKDQELKSLTEKNTTLNQHIQAENQRYKELDQEFNETIEEIARIKECGCWVYTRPIRIIKEKFTKGK